MSISKLLKWSVPLLLVNEVVGKTLVPIRPQTGSHNKRQEPTGFDLKDEEIFLWGTSSSLESELAALTIQTPGDAENILSMEKFDDMLTSIDCGDTSIEMTFQDSAAFAYAQRVWSWVNGAENNSFVMVAGAGDCGTNTDRIPFVISTLEYDEDANKVTLAAVRSDWTTIAHSYDLIVGSNSNQKSTQEEPILPRDIGKGASVNFNHHLDGFLALSKGDLAATVFCNDCSTFGSFDMQFKISQKVGVPTGASMTVRPNGVSTLMDVRLVGTGFLTDTLTKTVDLLSIPISGITIPGIFDFGPFLTVSLGADLIGLSINAGLNTGVKGTVKDSGILELNLLNPAENKFSGWEPSADFLETSVDGLLSGGAQVYLQTALELKAAALNQGFRIGLDLKLPQARALLSGVVSTKEVCPNSNQNQGVKADTFIGGSLGIKAFRKSDQSKPFVTLTLGQLDKSTEGLCFPFGPKHGARSVGHPHGRRLAAA